MGLYTVVMEGSEMSLRLRKNDHRACNKDHILLLLFPHHLILHGYKIWMPPVLENPYKWIP